MTRRPRTRAAVVLPVAAALLAGAGGTAYAVAQARGSAAQAVTVATFGAQAQPTAGPVQSGPLVLSYVQNSDQASRVFVVRNTGGLTLTSATFTVNITNTGGGSRGNGEFRMCLTLLSTCATYQALPFLTVAEGTPGQASTNVTLAPGAAFNVQFTPTGQLRQHNTTIGISVSRSQARAATVSSS